MKETFILLTIFFLSLFSPFRSFGQIELTLKKSIWFYPKEISRTTRFTVGSGNKIIYTKKDGEEYYPANFNKQRGFVEAFQISDEFQSTESVVAEKGNTAKSPSQRDLGLDYIHEAGKKIKSGATSQLIGYGIAIIGSAAGSYLSRKNPDLGVPIILGSSAIGFIITINGTSDIREGGKYLEKHKNE
jgi:hypothetical protein